MYTGAATGFQPEGGEFFLLIKLLGMRNNYQEKRNETQEKRNKTQNVRKKVQNSKL